MRASRQKRVGYVGWLDSIPAYLYVAPALLLYGIFFLWPLAHLVYLSMVKWKGLGSKVFVGLENYGELLTSDSRFWLAFQHNLLWMVAALFLPIMIGLFLAVFLVRSPLRGKLILRTIYFMPQVLSSVVVAIIWRWIYNPQYGALNSSLRAAGLDFLTRGWLGDRVLALPSLFIAWSWTYYGFCMVIFIAALQGIDEEYYDAAKVDGASALQQFWYVSLPFIRRPLATVMLITFIVAFQVFDLVFIITRGGPRWATLVLSVYMYDNAFRYAKVGYGSAIAVVLGAVIMFFSIVFFRVRERLVTE